MKYVGYLLFALIFVSITFLQSAKDFFVESYELAPEITILVSVSYIYIVFLTITLSLFPRISSDRVSLYDTHVKMACSVMVSLGLVGTFLGLVDMISGIGAALSGDEADFSKRMALLLGAISTSLGAMSFAFMTSILGVGISAYSLVAATFVGSFFSAEKREEAQKVSTETNLQTNLVTPIIERIDSLEKISNQTLEPVIQNNALSDRLTKLEDKISTLDITKFESELTPLAALDVITEHHKILEKHNELLTESIIHLNQNHIYLIDALNKSSQDTNNQNNLLSELNDTLNKANSLLFNLDESAHDIKNKTSIVANKLKKVFD